MYKLLLETCFSECKIFLCIYTDMLVHLVVK